jgi:hypothetical protein
VVRNRRRTRLRRSGPPASAWLTGLVAIALAGAFVVATALFRGVNAGPAAARLSVIGATTAIVLLAVFVAVLKIPWISPNVRRWSQLTLSLCLVVAGAMHFVLTREHLEESTLLGFGFVGAGLLQILLAAVVFRDFVQKREGRMAYLAVIGTNAALVFLYAVHVWLGLPVAGRTMSTTLGSQEQVDFPGILTKIAELISLVLAFVALYSFRLVKLNSQADPHRSSNWDASAL